MQKWYRNNSQERSYKTCQNFIIDLTEDLSPELRKKLLGCSDEASIDDNVSEKIRSFIDKAAHWIYVNKFQIKNKQLYLVDELTNSHVKIKKGFRFPNKTSLQKYINTMLSAIQRELTREECYVILANLDENIQQKLSRYCVDDKRGDYIELSNEDCAKITRRVTVWITDQKRSPGTFIWNTYGNDTWFISSPADTPKQYRYTFPTAAGFEAYIYYGKEIATKQRKQMQLAIGQHKATKRQELYQKSKLIFINIINELNDSITKNVLKQYFNCNDGDLSTKTKEVSENLHQVIMDAANWARSQVNRNFPAWRDYKKNNNILIGFFKLKLVSVIKKPEADLSQPQKVLMPISRQKN